MIQVGLSLVQREAGNRHLQRSGSHNASLDQMVKIRGHLDTEECVTH